MIPSTLEVLEERTFDECARLTSVVFSKGSRLREIGDHCFDKTGLKAFRAPPSLRKIGNGAFCFCKNLQRVVLNEGLEIVGTDNKKSRYENGAFECSDIKELVIPGTLVNLSENSFRDCIFLERVWVEQRCQINIANYVRSRVDVRVFRTGDKIFLSSIRSSAGNGK